MSDDARLIERTLAGDPSAFGCLVQKYQDRLYNALVQIAGGAAGAREDARDVAQDAFVQAFVKLETFRGSSQFYTWLYRIAFNLHVSRKRRQRPSVSIDRSREACGDEPSEDLPPAGDLEQQERAVQVREALALLSEEHRTILVLREIDDLDYEAIAEAMDIPIGTVRSRLHRARLQMRELLEQRVKEDLI